MAENESGLAVLKALYPVFEFRNRTSVSQVIVLAGGDSVQANPNGFIKIPSNLLIQVPSFQTFEPIKPKINEYVDAGVIKTNAPAPKPKQSGGTSSSTATTQSSLSSNVKESAKD